MVPRRTDLLKAYYPEESNNNFGITTLMIKNLPNKFSNQSLMAEVDSLGYAGLYDFVYVPMDIANQCNVGYAFINFETVNVCASFSLIMQGYQFRSFKSRKLGNAVPAHIQGFHQNVRHFSNTRVMSWNCFRPWIKEKSPVHNNTLEYSDMDGGMNGGGTESGYNRGYSIGDSDHTGNVNKVSESRSADLRSAVNKEEGLDMDFLNKQFDGIWKTERKSVSVETSTICDNNESSSCLFTPNTTNMMNFDGMDDPDLANALQALLEVLNNNCDATAESRL